MRRNSGHKAMLGMFVFVCIALFIAGVYFIGQRQQLFNETFIISGVFKDVSGLEVGNNVRFSGINVGIVDNITQISDTMVRVDMSIEESTRKFIKKNAKAMVGTDGLMGNKIMLIMPGTSGKEEVRNNDFIATSVPTNVDDILSKLKVTADNASVVSGELAEILVKINKGNGTFGRLIKDSTIAENINQTIVNLKKSTKGIDENVEAAKHNFLFKGYFNRKEKEAQRKKKADQKKADEEAAKNSNRK
jgi:phospholipid/cholesterol/gamma-HCH transport system substrate-binding protein